MPDDFTSRRPGGRLVRQPTTETIIRDLLARIDRLERTFSQVSSGSTVPTPGGGGGLSLVHSYPTPGIVQTWTIAHNLGRYAIVQVYDADGNEIVVDIYFPDLNTVTITSEYEFQGIAVIA